ncbi:zinc finger CCCH domain-containing protein 3 [Rhypophila decipiens]|uniref:Zinc finger CCCH domain-containing protein 3 n=1 Tax=Rhypophila decipiens TaxID=261697 RepID=A0AAN6Y685_9PEZI|nr:zinc finger CCCH domain-containing protein 3 [Rhypophila decipiens]
MSTDDREVLEKISRLAGQINRHKNQQAGFVPAPPQGSRYKPYNRSDPSDAWRRGGQPIHGHPKARMPVHRHRTLILNNSSSQPQSTQASDSDHGGALSDVSSSSWVTKTDRHLQLINSSVYEKETTARTRAIEQTRLQKQASRDARERAKLIHHINRVSVDGGGPTNSTASGAKYEITVQGTRFAVAKNGSKLVRIAGDNDSRPTPKMAIVGGVKFYRSKRGNLYRQGIVKAQRQSGAVKKVDVPCKMFSMTGSCAKGPRCRYVHNPEKVAACKDLLQQGQCPAGDSCDLSHELTPERTPACLHFAKDNCNKPDCRYTHVKVSPAAPVCRSFGLYGYCEKGASCTDRHVFECPDFSNTGVCKTKGCKLPHRERASVLRKAANRSPDSPDHEMEDLSSDEESVDSDDVDSDEVDEFIGPDGDGDFDIADQRDFIEL